jgi:raffinose/stachyose/melibiose transport system substrate-binding protein
LWGLATSTEAAYFWYNKDIFTKYNLTPPTTLDDLITMCKTLKAAGVTPIALGDSEKWPAAHYMSIINQKVVGDKVVDADAMLQTPADQLFKDPNYVKALDYFVSMQKAGCFSQGVVGSDHNVEWSQFYSGKSAMEYDGTWVLSVWNGNGMQGKYGLFRFPSIPGGVGDQNEILMGPIGLEIMKSTKYPDQAAKFIDYYVNATNQRSMVDISQRIPVRSSVIDPTKDDPVIVAIVQDMAKASGSTVWQDGANDNAVTQAMYDTEQELLGGTMTSQQVMDAIRAAALKAQAARTTP